MDERAPLIERGEQNRCLMTFQPEWHGDDAHAMIPVVAVTSYAMAGDHKHDMETEP